MYICALLGKILSPVSLGGWQRCSGTAWCWCDFHKHLSASGSASISAIISFFMLCLHFGLASGHWGFLVFGKGATWQMSERALAVIKTLQLWVRVRRWRYFLTAAGCELWRRNWGVFEALADLSGENACGNGELSEKWQNNFGKVRKNNITFTHCLVIRICEQKASRELIWLQLTNTQCARMLAGVI